MAKFWNADAVPTKGRPGPAWDVNPPLTVKLLLSTAQLNPETHSILNLHLTAQHLLVIAAPVGTVKAAQGKAAAATWLDAAQLRMVAERALPAGICQAWSDPSSDQMTITCYNGDVYIMSTNPKVSTTASASEPVACYVGRESYAFLTAIYRFCQTFYVHCTKALKIHQKPSSMIAAQSCHNHHENRGPAQICNMLVFGKAHACVQLQTTQAACLKFCQS